MHTLPTSASSHPRGGTSAVVQVPDGLQMAHLAKNQRAGCPLGISSLPTSPRGDSQILPLSLCVFGERKISGAILHGGSMNKGTVGLSQHHHCYEE